MLSPDKTHQNLAGKLLLSSALVAVSLAYGWWGRQPADRPVLATAPAPLSKKLAVASPRPAPALLAPAAPPSETQDADAASAQDRVPDQAAAQPQQPAAIAKAAPQKIAPSAAPAPPPQQNSVASAPMSSPPIPQPVVQSPPPVESALPLEAMITGAPEPGAKSPAPPGMHLEDGDYISSRHEFMWGDLRVKIAVRGGLIAGVQILQYPDHRSQSTYLSQMAIPILEREVIKKQSSMVDTVSSATDTSYVFQDAVADAITKATRG